MKSIRHDYPNLYLWLRRLYWDESELTRGGVFRKTSNFEAYRYGYARARGRMLKGGDVGDEELERIVMPRGPSVDIDLGREEEKLK